MRKQVLISSSLILSAAVGAGLFFYSPHQVAIPIIFDLAAFAFVLVDKKGIIRYLSKTDRSWEFLNPDIIFSR